MLCDQASSPCWPGQAASGFEKSIAKQDGKSFKTSSMLGLTQVTGMTAHGLLTGGTLNGATKDKESEARVRERPLAWPSYKQLSSSFLGLSE